MNNPSIKKSLRRKSSIPLKEWNNLQKQDTLNYIQDQENRTRLTEWLFNSFTFEALAAQECWKINECYSGLSRNNIFNTYRM